MYVDVMDEADSCLGVLKANLPISDRNGGSPGGLPRVGTLKYVNRRVIVENMWLM